MKFTIEIDIPELDSYQSSSEKVAAIEAEIKQLIQVSETPITSEPGKLTSLLTQAQAVMNGNAPDNLPEMLRGTYAATVRFYVLRHVDSAFHQLHVRIQDILKANDRYLKYPSGSHIDMESGLKNVTRYLGDGTAQRLRQQAQAEAQTIIDNLHTEKE